MDRRSRRRDRRADRAAGLGADLRLGSVRSQRDPDLARQLADAPDAYVIPRGGTSALGNLGFVAAGLELAEQVERGELPAPDVVYMAMGTMGSVAGLAIGLEAGGLETRVAAVRASNPGTSSRAKLDATLAETIALLRLGVPAFRAVDDAGRRIRIVEDQLGAGYGRPTPAGERALALAEEDAGLRLERTYTAKALAAIVADAPSLRDRTVLFWNTHSSRPLPPPADPGRLPAALRGWLEGVRFQDRGENWRE